jgi:carboxymethylenebutenolidase
MTTFDRTYPRRERPGAYEAHPAGEAIGLVLVAHEIFGLTPHIKSVCDRLAALGFLAIAPDLFADHLDGLCLPYTEAGKKEGLRIKNALTEEGLLETLSGISQRTTYKGPCAVIGFCLGGTLAWMAASTLDLRASVGYYPVGIGRHLKAAPRCPVLLHFGRHDRSITAAEVDAVATAYPTVDLHTYEAGHAFNRDDDAAYEPMAATAAWRRTAEFLQAHMISAGAIR